MRRFPCTAFAVVSMMLCAASARGQDVLSGLSNWSSTITGLPLDPGPGGKSGNVTGDTSGIAYDGSAPGRGLTLLGYEARVTEDWADPTEGYRLRISQQQTFTLGETGIANIPVFLNGTITFAGPPFGPAPSNFAFGEVTGTVDIFDASGTSVLSVTKHFSHIASVGSLAVNGFFFAETPSALAAATYRLRATIEIAGHSGSISSLPGAESFVDFLDTGAKPQRGLAVSLGTYKEGLGNSREAVTAPLARSDFSVDGTGIKVGVLEVRIPKTTHASLPGARLTVLPGDTAGNFVGEHALATSGIVGAADADTGNAGIAPGASIIAAGSSSFSGGFDAALTAILGSGAQVISRSAGIDFTPGSALPTGRMTYIDAKLNANPRVTWANAAGNNGDWATQSVDEDGLAYNIISVGALDRNFTRRADFSSFSHGVRPIKPDIVAPGEYITAPVGQDINDDSLVNDFHKTFLGDNYSGDGGQPLSGPVSGTSFATPMVAGAAALLYDYQRRNKGTLYPAYLDDDSVDHRVIKAVLLNGARTSGLLHLDGTTGWGQGFGSGAGHIVVNRSLDTELGAGILDTHKALEIFKSPEFNAGDGGAANEIIDPTPGITAFGSFWDRDTVLSGAGGTVDYLLRGAFGAHLRATLAWDSRASIAGGTDIVDHLELRLYREGLDDGVNILHLGFDPTHPDVDVLIAETSELDENVKLLDMDLPTGPIVGHLDGYYLEVVNLSGTSTIYGLAVIVPEPAGLAMLLLPLALLPRRRK